MILQKYLSPWIDSVRKDLVEEEFNKWVADASNTSEDFPSDRKKRMAQVLNSWNQNSRSLHWESVGNGLDPFKALSMMNLRSLDLEVSGSAIGVPEDALYGLQYLTLRGNPVATVHFGGRSCRNVIELRVDNSFSKLDIGNNSLCRLRNIIFDFPEMITLKSLVIGKNALTCLPHLGREALDRRVGIPEVSPPFRKETLKDISISVQEIEKLPVGDFLKENFKYMLHLSGTSWGLSCEITHSTLEKTLQEALVSQNRDAILFEPVWGSEDSPFAQEYRLLVSALSSFFSDLPESFSLWTLLACLGDRRHAVAGQVGNFGRFLDVGSELRVDNLKTPLSAPLYLRYFDLAQQFINRVGGNCDQSRLGFFQYPCILFCEFKMINFPVIIADIFENQQILMTFFQRDTGTFYVHHTPVSEMKSAVSYLEFLLKKFSLNLKIKDKNSMYLEIATIHYFLVQLCCFKRGSAAIAEIIIRSLFAAVDPKFVPQLSGIDRQISKEVAAERHTCTSLHEWLGKHQWDVVCGHRSPVVFSDLEAMTSLLSPFLRNYWTMLRSIASNESIDHLFVDLPPI